jgi:hypothetical protein
MEAKTARDIQKTYETDAKAAMELTKATWKRLSSIKVDPKYVSGTPEERQSLATAETASTEELTQCIRVVSTMRVKQAVPLLIELLAFCTVAPDRPASLDDYPSAIALVEVGSPAIPELHKLSSNPSKMKLAVDVTGRILGWRLALLLLSDDQLMADVPEENRKTIKAYALSRFEKEHSSLPPRDAIGRDLTPQERSPKGPPGKDQIAPTADPIPGLTERIGLLEDSIRKLSAPDNSVERLRDTQARTDELQGKDIQQLAKNHGGLNCRVKYIEDQLTNHIADQLKKLTDEIQQLKQRMDKAAVPAVPAPRPESGSK